MPNLKDRRSSSGHVVVKVTAIVPAFNRIGKSIETLSKIYNCIPRPAEVIVHVDDDRQQYAKEIKNAFPETKVLGSVNRVGPGGSRNKMIEAASYNLVASFDDDSYPLDCDYFQKVVQVADALPNASIISAALYHPGEQIESPTSAIIQVADFPGCACVYRRDHFKDFGGYLPIAVPYGIEEVDLALRYCSRGATIYRADCLRVFHDNDRLEHADASITAASVLNIALLAFLRYPVACWPIGALQVMKRVVWLIKVGRFAGIFQGLRRIPAELLRFRGNRNPLPTSAIFSYLRLRRSFGVKST
jgi:glycosyltransferase involved in cell wall biosynthesis